MFHFRFLPNALRLLPLLALLAPAAAMAADPADTVLARRGEVVITRADWDAELLRIPPKDRAEFASNLRRNYSLLERMLTTRELALEAKQKKLDADPMTRTRIRQEEDRILAAALDRLRRGRGRARLRAAARGLRAAGARALRGRHGRTSRRPRP